MPRGVKHSASLTPAQLRRLQTLWRRRFGPRRLWPERDRALRHAYIKSITRGRAQETKEMTAADAALVIRQLERSLRGKHNAAYSHVLGTAGRRGFEDHPEVAASADAFRLLYQHAAALRMSRTQLDRFIARHYDGVGLRGRADIRTMADLNRVLWGLKALLRRRATKPARLTRRQAA